MPTYRAPDGSALHYDVVGDSAVPPLVVLAGGAARHPSYLGDLAGLASLRPLVVPHLRGVGRSPAPSEAEAGSYWRQADDLEALREALGLDRLLLGGHSAGTRVATAYAVRYPTRLAALVLVTPPAGHLVDERSDVAAIAARRRGEPAFDRALEAFQTGPDASSEATFNAWQQAIAPATYARWGEREQAHAGVGSYSLAAARAFFSVEPPADLATRLAAVTAPVLVLAGAEDAIAGAAPVAALAGRFPAGRAVVLDACGHYPWVEQPAAFRAAADASVLSAPSSRRRRGSSRP